MSAIAKRPDAYEHVQPDAVGNGTRFVVSELAGQARPWLLKAKELGLELDGPQAERRRRHAEAARARGLPLRGRRRVARAPDAPGERVGAAVVRRSESFRVITDDLEPVSEVGDAPTRRHHRGDDQGPRRRRAAWSPTAEGNGPVNALDAALRQRARTAGTRRLERVHLTDYKVRVLDTAEGHRCRHPGARRQHRTATGPGPRSA